MQINLFSWNVNGIRAAIKKGLWTKLDELKPDILCIQETKADSHKMAEIFPERALSFEQVIDEKWNHKNVQVIYHSASIKKGYSGVATLTHRKQNKVKLLEKRIGTGFAEFDAEGMVVITEYEVLGAKKKIQFVLINGYYPQGGRGEHRIEYKIKFYNLISQKIKDFRSKGQKVILCGDLNTTVKDIDLARPKANRKTTGCLPEEREALNKFFELGLVDSFRYFYPDTKDKYSYWDQITRARDRNVGWRIDYFLVDKDLLSYLKSAQIHDQVMGSDHAPVSISLDF